MLRYFTDVKGEKIKYIGDWKEADKILVEERQKHSKRILNSYVFEDNGASNQDILDLIHKNKTSYSVLELYQIFKQPRTPIISEEIDKRIDDIISLYINDYNRDKEDNSEFIENIIREFNNHFKITLK